MLPIFPLIMLAQMGIGAAGLYWYKNLPSDEKEEADRAAAECARQLFGKALNQLTADQAHKVHEMVKRQFVN
jgi:hypothetical protein